MLKKNYKKKKLLPIFQDIICFLPEEKEGGQDYETVVWASRDSSSP